MTSNRRRWRNRDVGSACQLRWQSVGSGANRRDCQHASCDVCVFIRSGRHKSTNKELTQVTLSGFITVGSGETLTSLPDFHSMWLINECTDRVHARTQPTTHRRTTCARFITDSWHIVSNSTTLCTTAFALQEELCVSYYTE